jgi:deleted-in-malignant-brain-tumors protein 1
MDIRNSLKPGCKTTYMWTDLLTGLTMPAVEHGGICEPVCEPGYLPVSAVTVGQYAQTMQCASGILTPPTYLCGKEVICQIATSGTLDSIYYYKQDMTHRLEVVNGTLQFTFAAIPGSDLVISVHVSDEESSFCSTGAMVQLHCNDGVETSLDWDVYSSHEPIDRARLKGEYVGWRTPEVCGKSHLYDTPNVKKIWSGYGGKFVAFRWKSWGPLDLALKSEKDDGTFRYFAPLWGETEPASFGSDAVGVNFLSSYIFTKIKMIGMKFVMNDMETLVSLPMLLRASHSLQELADAQNSVVPAEAITRVQPASPASDPDRLPLGFLSGHTPGWTSESVIDYFGLLGAQSETLERLYCGFGFDMQKPGSVWTRVRIGNILDDTSTCQHPNGAEGIGLYDGSSSASSGTVDFRARHVFSKASIYVGGIALAEGDLRLAGVSSGRLSVYHAGKWGTICNQSFANSDAQVACRILGFAGGVAIWAPGGTGKIWMAGVRCAGQETNFKDCTHDGWEMHDCDHEMDVGIECMREDQYMTFTGCFSLEGANQTLDLAFGPQSSGHNTATCGVACRDYTYMALREGGVCSCADAIKFDNMTADGECGPVCPGELDLGPTRYCGAVLRSAVYQLIHNRTVEVIEAIEENVTIPPNITILNITPEVPAEVPAPKDPALQFTLYERFSEAPGGENWLLEPDVSKTDYGPVLPPVH